MAELITKNPQLVAENQAWFEFKENDVMWDKILAEPSDEDEEMLSTRPSNNDDEADRSDGGGR